MSRPPTRATEAVCPRCKLELTSSKKIEKVRSTEQHPDAGVVFWCPECSEFFEAKPGDNLLRPPKD
jgi:hypothetical protein